MNKAYSKGIVHIGSNSVISMGAIITSGSIIGENCIVGAGSVVVSNIPANSVAAGVPARVIKERGQDLKKFWNLKDEYICRIAGGEDMEIQSHMIYNEQNNYFVFNAEPDEKGKIGKITWGGVEVAGSKIAINELPENFRKYMNQLALDELMVCDDLFLELNLPD